MEQIIEAKKILVRAPNWVGDVVMATPAFRCIGEAIIRGSLLYS